MYDEVYAKLTDVQRWALIGHIDSIADDDWDCSDNYRLARADNEEEMNQYDAQAARGCCGSYDIVIPCVDGNLHYGFNYGH